MISKKTKYGLRAMMALAKHGSDEPLLIAHLAEAEGIPKKFLEFILLELKNKGLLRSKKGKGGGYSLARTAESITLGEIIRTLDGPLAPVPCVSHTAYSKCDECQDEAACGIRAVMADVRDAMTSVLDRETLAGLVRREERLEQKHRKVLTYAI